MPAKAVAKGVREPERVRILPAGPTTVQNGGEPTALNGFDYLFIESPNGLLPLKKLRDRLMGPDIRAEAAHRVEDAKRYGLNTAEEDHIPEIKKRRGM